MQYNFQFSDGQVSQVKSERELSAINIIGGGLDVRRVSLWYNSDGMLFGIQLFSERDECLLTTAYSFVGKNEHVIKIEKDERIIGFKARSYSNTHAAYYDF